MLNQITDKNKKQLWNRDSLFVLGVVLITLFFSQWLKAEDLRIHAPDSSSFSTSALDLSTMVDVYIDDKGTATYYSIIDNPIDITWKRNKNSSMNFGFQDKPTWLRGKISNTQNASQDLLLVVESPTLDYLDLYWMDENERVNTIATGNARPYKNRQIDNRNFLFPLTIPAKSTIEFYLRAQESGSLQLPISLWSPNAYYESYQYEQAKFSMYFGVLITLVLYNLFLWVSIRSQEHAYYVLYILAISFVQASQTGIGSQFIWPNLPDIASLVVQVSVPLSVLFAAMFGIHTLRLNKNEWVWKLNYYVIAAAVILLILIPITSVGLHLKVSVIFGVLGSVIFLTTGLVKWRGGDEATRLFTIAWFALLFGTITYGSTKLGLLPVNAFSNNILWIGSAVEGILLSFSVGARINQIQREKSTLERRNVESKLRHLELESIAVKAEAENKAKSDFIATFSHEVRTPINGVLGMTELLADTPLNEEQTEFVGVIKYSGNTLLNLINDVLDYSKIEAGKMTVEIIETDLNELIEASLSLFTVQARELGLDLKMELVNKVPRYIKTDPIRMTQILNNLLSNAMKFTEVGSVSLSVSADEVKKRFRFEVTDTGIGLNQEQQSNLFQSFQQADKSTTRKYGGTGLGLAICKQLVHLMQGEIGVDSESGKGSTFWFEIPLLRVSVAEINAFIETHDREAHIDLKGMRVLAAEDNNVNQMVLARYLRKMNCKVTFANNGRIAVDEYQRDANNYDLILMDYEMPELDGMDASQKIRDLEQSNGWAPKAIIMLTAHTLPNTLEKLKLGAVDDILIKPIERKSLQDLLLRYAKQSEYLGSD